ncbi:restriction endonuclease subunit S [Vibrio parahaemolyticus]|uniref:restriction endonuclease subunit S n=4 Tax=Vibrio parahaemolyticus TaxID=670 RepID=UPI000471DD8F|nr:restriction endonuclease subunit S [Vibrio parahaemolyticus]EHK0749312.1 restriction endonuclease subunit S [Vibrio parahaemolyticus]EJB8570346.1 restriction endonuclease subunit S [Vibrio parahaemolyticus]EJE4176755.1 restriction endonuclease subunit S [Vibrio parahaemolyticus]ELB2948633.1 restriction endonuclease subunit S [Vibrio parahaemolyticus]MCR9783161.1 restriction endonuclease subunit S [Vibrio parahaemolyticus]
MSWPLVKLGEVAKLINGDRGKNYPSKGSFVDEGIPFINAGCLSNEHTLIEGALNYITEDKFDSLRSGKVEKGDILFCLRGSLGKFALVDTNMKGAIASSLVIIRANEKVHIDYLKHYLGSFLCQREIQAYENGAAQPNLSATDLKNFEIPLPPLAEQKRIAAILDKADAIRQKRKQAIELADEFLRSVFLDMFGDPVTNPKGWEVKKLSNIAHIQIGPFGTQLHKEDYIENGIPLINPTHIVQGSIVPNSNLTISSKKHRELSEYHLKAGDIVMGRRGEMGRCAIVHEQEAGWLCGTGSVFIRPQNIGVFSEYLNKLLSSQAIKKHLESESQGATMPNLNKTIVGNIQIPVPSDEALEQFSLLKAKCLNYLEISNIFSSEQYFEALGQKAFSGQL